MDNILLAQEIIKDSGRSNGKLRCVVELDIKKAFDSVNWAFILNILKAMNSRAPYIGWIMECICTPTFSLCFNKNLEGYIKGGKGIRQGDPLSPYIFIICMEVLSKMMDSAARENLISYHPRCKKLHITHLTFAGDLIVFTTLLLLYWDSSLSLISFTQFQASVLVMARVSFIGVGLTML